MHAKVEGEETALWEEIQMVLTSAMMEELEGQEFIDFCNNAFENRELQAKLQMKDNDFLLTYGKNNTKMVLTNEKLHILKEYAIVEGSPDDWDFEIKTDGTLKLTAYKQEKSGIITIPNTIDAFLVTEIGDNIFRNSSGITELIFSDGLEIIGNSTFANCKNIVNKIHFSNTLQEIKDTAFYGCANIEGDLNEIVAMNLKMGKNVFGGCTKLTGDIAVLMETLDPSATTITSGQFSGFGGVTGILEIPKRITKIENNAFEGCAKITGMIFEENSALTEIDDYAFYECASLSGTVEFPETLVSIGQYAFYNDNKITCISFGVIKNEGENHTSALTTIDAYCFGGCSGLSGDIVFPGSLTSIGMFGFTRQGNTGRINLIFEKTSDEELAIEKYCFSNEYNGEMKKNITIDFGSRVVNLKVGVFMYSNVTSAVNSERIVKIGSNCFDTNRNLDMDFSGVTGLGGSAFRNTSLSKLPSTLNISVINESCFEDCKKLKVDDNNTNIITYLENNCPSLTTINKEAFASCSLLTGTFAGELHNRNANNKKITLADGVFINTGVEYGKIFAISGDTIPANAYKDVTVLLESDGVTPKTNITIPANITSIGNNAFSGCKSITSITFADGSNLTTIGDYAFFHCENITNFSFPAKCSSIGEWCFGYCYALTTVTFQGNLITELPFESFRYCTSLSTISLSNISIIGDWVFGQCFALRNIDLSGVTSIGSRAFRYSGVTNIVSLDSLTFLGEGAFRQSSLSGSITIPNNCTIDRGEQFWATSITSLTLPSSMSVVPYDMCYSCKSLATVTFSGNPTKIDTRAFYNCIALTTVSISLTNLNYIGVSAFENCSSMVGTWDVSNVDYYDQTTTFKNCSLTLI